MMAGVYEEVSAWNRAGWEEEWIGGIKEIRLPGFVECLPRSRINGCFSEPSLRGREERTEPRAHASYWSKRGATSPHLMLQLLCTALCQWGSSRAEAGVSSGRDGSRAVGGPSRVRTLQQQLAESEVPKPSR